MAKILIVEDSLSQVNLIKKIVESLGHEAILAADGVQAIELAHRELPDVILMDIVLPNMNGFQATRSIVRDPQTQHIPIAIITTKDQDPDRSWGLRQGARHYLTKPFTDGQLIELIQSLLAPDEVASED